MTTTDLSMFGVPLKLIANHFSIPIEKDYFLSTPIRNVAHWSETGAFFALNPDENVVVFTHFGRCQQDLDLWWSHTLIFLPDGEILADRSFGRTLENRGGVGAGSVKLTIEEPFKRWHVSFDGHGERTSVSGLAQQVRGHGPGVAVRFDVTGEALSPCWDMTGGKSHSVSNGSMSNEHLEQNFRTCGKLNVAGQEYSLIGVGWNDHSRGPRTFDSYGSHRWLSAILPGLSIHALSAWGPEGNKLSALGSMFLADGTHESIAIETFPDISDTVGGPLNYEIVLAKQNGAKVALQVETLHPYVMSIDGDNENFNGICWNGTEIMTCHWGSFVRVTMEDGRFGYAYAERGYRLSKVKKLLNL